ncbi:ImuA family protein [Psychromarinibacter sp. S121]|uniref:ImuA family protein n=1 Tax=Psychromarinibacter sp. S121 TaxID=3415127 RepID=UPI003C7E3F69
MTAHLLSRSPSRDRDRPALSFLDGMALPLARAHEFCGDARRTLAALVAARTEGPVFWISPSWLPERLNPEAAAHLFDPGRVVFLEPQRAEDLLWCLEEVLRAGVVPLAVADLPGPPGMTAVRRLHLAAETGAAEGEVAPLGLILTPGDGGAPGIESRWRLRSAHGMQTDPAGKPRQGWHLHRLRARTAPVQGWQMTTGPQGFRTEPLAAAA